MNHPRHEILEARTQMAPERTAGLVLVGLLHVAVIYALASGLAVKFIKQIPHEISAQVIPEQQPQTAPPPPPPTQMQVPTLPTVTPPDIEVPQTPTPSPTISVQAQPQPPAAVTQPASTSAAGIASTHTIPPYPEQSRRLGQQGTVTLRVSIGADGTVTDTQVEKSSGVPELDQAAVVWVKAHWKYKPAMQNGQPIASTSEAAVVFNLRNAS